jgi:hypothetical protein
MSPQGQSKGTNNAGFLLLLFEFFDCDVFFLAGAPLLGRDDDVDNDAMFCGIDIFEATASAEDSPHG